MGEKPRFRVGLTFRFGDVFPASDPVARWLVTLAVALVDLNWVEAKMDQAQAEDDDDSIDRPQYFRMVCLQFWEVAKFVEETYDSSPEIRAFVDALPDHVREHFSALRGMVTNDAELGGIRVELVKVRDFRAHYPWMHPRGRDPIALGMKEGEDSDVTVVSSSDVNELWFEHAEAIIAQSLLSLIPTEADSDRVFGMVREGTIHVLMFVLGAHQAWFSQFNQDTSVFRLADGIEPIWPEE
jgi:hypothetical protein